MGDRARHDCVGLTRGLEGYRIAHRAEEPPETEAARLLNPLREGRPVVLVVTDPKLPKKRRAEKPRLFLTPVSAYGPPSRLLVASLEAYGCEVLDTSEAIPMVSLVRLGLSPKLARGLAIELDRVFNREGVQT